MYLMFETPYDYNAIAKVIEKQETKPSKKKKKSSGGISIIENAQ